MACVVGGLVLYFLLLSCLYFVSRLLDMIIHFLKANQRACCIVLVAIRYLERGTVVSEGTDFTMRKEYCKDWTSYSLLLLLVGK